MSPPGRAGIDEPLNVYWSRPVRDTANVSAVRTLTTPELLKAQPRWRARRRVLLAGRRSLNVAVPLSSATALRSTGVGSLPKLALP